MFASPNDDEALVQRMRRLGIREDDLRENFIRGAGAGGGVTGGWSAPSSVRSPGQVRVLASSWTICTVTAQRIRDHQLDWSKVAALRQVQTTLVPDRSSAIASPFQLANRKLMFVIQ